MPVQFDERTRTFLSEPNAAVLATVSPKGRPQATPVWYLVEGDEVIFNTSRGRMKLRNLEANPHVALTIVDPKNIYRYVQIRGKVVRFDPKNGARDIERLSQRYTGKAYTYPGGSRPEDRVTVLIKPVSISALRR